MWQLSSILTPPGIFCTFCGGWSCILQCGARGGFHTAITHALQAKTDWSHADFVKQITYWKCLPHAASCKFSTVGSNIALHFFRGWITFVSTTSMELNQVIVNAGFTLGNKQKITWCQTFENDGCFISGILSFARSILTEREFYEGARSILPHFCSLSSHLFMKSSELVIVNLVHIWPSGTQLMQKKSFEYKKNIGLDLDMLIYAFFFYGDAVLFQCMDCCLVSQINWKIQIHVSQLITLEKLFGSFPLFSSVNTNFHPMFFFLRSEDFGIVFTHTFLMPRFSLKFSWHFLYPNSILHQLVKYFEDHLEQF